MKNLKYSALLLGVMANFAIAGDGAAPMTRKELSTSSASETTSVGSAGQNTFAVPRGEQTNTYNTVNIVSASSGGGQASVVDRASRTAPVSVRNKPSSIYNNTAARHGGEPLIRVELKALTSDSLVLPTYAELEESNRVLQEQYNDLLNQYKKAHEEDSKKFVEFTDISTKMKDDCKSLTNQLIAKLKPLKDVKRLQSGQPGLSNAEIFGQKIDQLKAAQDEREKAIQELKAKSEKEIAARKELYQEIPSEEAGTNIPLRYTANNAAGKRQSNANKGQHKNYRSRIAVTLGAAGLAAFAFGMHKLVSPTTALVQW